MTSSPTLGYYLHSSYIDSRVCVLTVRRLIISCIFNAVGQAAYNTAAVDQKSISPFSFCIVYSGDAYFFFDAQSVVHKERHDK